MSEHENTRFQMDAALRLSKSTELTCKLFFQDGKEVNTVLKDLEIDRYELEMTIGRIGKDLIKEVRGFLRVTQDAIAYENRLEHLKKQDRSYKNYDRRRTQISETASGHMSDSDAIRWVLKDRGEE